MAGFKYEFKNKELRVREGEEPPKVPPVPPVVPPATPPPGAPPPAGFNPEDEEQVKKLSPEWQDHIKKIRRESAQRRTEMTKLEAAAAELAILKTEKETAETAKLKEQGEFKKLLEASEAKVKALEEETKVAAAKNALLKEGALSEDVVKLLDMTKPLPAAITELKAAHPYAFKPAVDPPTATGSSKPEPRAQGGASPPSLNRDQLKTMTPQQKKAAEEEFLRTWVAPV